MFCEEIHVGSALYGDSTIYYRSECQRRTLLCTNPISYKADNVGQKANVSQNEKLTMFGCVVHVCAGFSGNTISFVTLPVQNCVIIYEHLYIHMSYVWHSVCRHMVLTYRLGIKSEWTMGLNEPSCCTCINLAAKWNCTHKLPYALCCIV